MTIGTVEEFIQCALEYNKENNIILDIKKPMECPVHVFASTKNVSCKGTVGGIKNCPLCGAVCCPICFNHNNIQQISRVTGYMQVVSGFNEAKKQELKDRKRYIIR